MDVPLVICAILSESRSSGILQYMGNHDSFVKNDKGLPYVNTKDTIIMYKCF